MSRLDDLDETVVAVDAPQETIVPKVLEDKPAPPAAPPATKVTQTATVAQEPGERRTLLEAVFAHYGFVRRDASPQETTPADRKKERPERGRAPVKTWAVPLLAASAVLLLMFSLGVVFGVLLSHGATPVIAHIATVAHLPGGILLAPLLAPAGVLLFLLGALYCWAAGYEQKSGAWNLLGWVLIALFIMGIV